jgi:penicillin-binding protein 1A
MASSPKRPTLAQLKRLKELKQIQQLKTMAMDPTTQRWSRRGAIGVFSLGVVGVIAGLIAYEALARGVPSIEKIRQYEPAITSRVHAGDGTLIAEFADQHRVYVPYESIPEHVIQAFVSAEDKNFFKHDGLDYTGMARAAARSAKNKVTGDGGLEGGSTITQQVAKNMLLTRDQTFRRKAKEAKVAQRMEKEFSKGEILELYLNEIYLGGRAYGVGSAALNYFNKSLPELDLSEAAILASLPKAPGRKNPYNDPEGVMARRNYVLERMREDGYITKQEMKDAMAKPLTTQPYLRGPEFAATTYFVQELRGQLIEQYGEDTLEKGGLSIRSTIDTNMQLAAQTALQNGLIAFERNRAYRGPVTNIKTGDGAVERLKAVELPAGHGTWEGAMVQKISANSAELLLTDGATIKLPAEELAWANRYKKDGRTGLRTGDVVVVELKREILNSSETQGVPAGAETDPDGEPVDEAAPAPMTVPVGNATLRQVPEVEGSLVALDPHSGRILAMQGGFSFFKSSFNRATQAKRQTGSAFKPFVYAAALEKGYTPSTRQLDETFVYYDPVIKKYWSPANYTKESLGSVTMRVALEKSLNQVTARIAMDVGMDRVSELSERLGVYEKLPPYPAMSLGSGEALLVDLARGYASFVNGGKKVTPTLLDRVQDRHGKTLFQHDKRACTNCQAEDWSGGAPPALEDVRPQVLDPIVAYQVTHMLEGVVERGTARRAQKVGRPLAGKTGTTNDYRDAIFVGFSPDLVVAIRIGYDDNRELGEGMAGGAIAVPIFTEFMQKALVDQPVAPFRIPPGVRLVKVDARTGALASGDSAYIIDEAFRPGTEPGFGSIIDSGDELSIFGTVEPSTDPGAAGTATTPPEDVVAGDLGDVY